MRVSSSNSMYPVVRRSSTAVSETNTSQKTEKNHPVAINEIVNSLIEQKYSSLAKPGKGFYIVINNPNFNSYAKKIKSVLTPVQEQINKTYHLGIPNEPGLLVDMIV